MIDALPLLLGDDGYQISRSVRLRSSATAFFSRTPASAGNRRTWTWSCWVKRGRIGAEQGLFYRVTNLGNDTNSLGVQFDAGDTLTITGYSTVWRRTTAVYRDPSAWYHVHVTVDTTQATAANRVRLYINGVEVTAFSTSNNPTQNADLGVNDTTQHSIGSEQPYTSGREFDGYLTDINFIDGQALTPAAFGETDAITGVWKPRRYTGTYGTNGFFLNFSDPSAATAAAIGRDYSGNGNNWTPNNISVTAGATYDSMLDVPTPWADGGNGRGNYCVLNPLARLFGSPTFADGNLRTTAVNAVSSATMNFPSTGKWYFEATVSGLSTAVTVGICNTSPSRSAEISYQNNGNRNAGGGSAAYGATYTTNDVIGVAVDCDAATVTFYKNNVSQGSLAFSLSSLSSSDIVAQLYTQAGSDAWIANFGQRPFAYTPPAGFRALNTQNLPEPTIKKGGEYFNPVLYTGNNSTTQSINVGLVPDLVWIKSRTSGTGHHSLIDRVRGDVALNSNQTIAEYGVTAFNMNTDGTIDVPYYASDYSMNTSANSYVAWNWKESPSAGFDIVTYTGTGSARTVSHSLGVAPRMMIVKSRTTASGWAVYHGSIAATNYLLLESTAASAAGTTVWNSTAPTSSVFSVGTDGSVNGSTRDYVAYLFSEVAGFSRFGSYTGNGSADGPMVFTGFLPRWVMIKRTDSTENWQIVDSARDITNVTVNTLFPNLSNSESTGVQFDFTSNGFKVRSTTSGGNASGATYIFAAFAETPQKFSLAR